MNRRAFLLRLAWLPLLGPALSRVATAPYLPPVRQGVTFMRVGALRMPEWAATRSWLGPDFQFKAYKGTDIVQGRHFVLSTGWRGWIENGRGQVIAYVKQDWSVWGTP